MIVAAMTLVIVVLVLVDARVLAMQRRESKRAFTNAPLPTTRDPTREALLVKSVPIPLPEVTTVAIAK